MSFSFSESKPRLQIITAVILLFAIAGCVNSSIVGKWRMMGGSNATLWEFSSNGAVLVGDVRGKYEFGDQDRIKIQTPVATTVYQMKISGDQMTLQEPGGSKLQFTRIKEAQR
jgi:DNA-binding transcriptional regulator of glucitol operon